MASSSSSVDSGLAVLRTTSRTSSRPTPSTSSDSRIVPDIHTPSFDIRLGDDDDESSESQVYLSVMWKGGQLGAAYYDADSTEIYLLQDTVETDNFLIIKTLIQQIKPICISASCKQDDRLLKVIREMTSQNLDSSLGGLVLLPSIEYSEEICQRRVLYQDLPSLPKHYNDSERSIYMSSLIDFDKKCMVRAAGGLIKLLEKKRVGIELEDADTRVPILAFKTLRLNDMMLMDENSYTALQIFQREAHPSVYKVGTAREAMSLYRHLNQCSSVAGSKLFRLWFLRPLVNLEELQQRQNAVAFFKDQRNDMATSTLQKCLRQIKDISRILVRMTRAQATVGDWKALCQTVLNAECIKEVCKAFHPEVSCSIFNKIDRLFTGELNKLATTLRQVMDLEQSEYQNKFVPKSGFSEQLDKLRREFNELPDLLTNIAQEEVSKLPGHIKECNVIRLSNLGYMLEMTSHVALEENDRDIPDMTFICEEDGKLYYTSRRTVQLDDMFGDIQSDIKDLEASVMHALQETVLRHSQMLLDVVECAAELDCLISLATSAKQLGYCRPVLSERVTLQIKGGRHPLQEHTCSPYIPNDTHSGGGHSKMKLLTGPNASGKSVYLKQVGLIVYMAQIGSFVPAEEAEIGLVDGIFTRICTIESVSNGMSSFMIDLNQMANALSSATSRSLVLIDEFGKGTDTEDGIALLCSSLRYWLEKEDLCPHAFVSSHFHSVIQQRLLPDTPLLQYQTMEVLQDGAEMVFLYQLIEGSTNQSFACHVAETEGLPEELVARGAEVSDLIRQNKPVNQIDGPSSDTQYKRYTAIVSRFLDLDLEKGDVKDFLTSYVIPCSEGKLEI